MSRIVVPLLSAGGDANAPAPHGVTVRAGA
jgi:hypothetical protein